MFITYNPSEPYPQTPQPGKGVIVDGVQTPPPGMASFEVDHESLLHQKQSGERWNQVLSNFYEITAPGVLTPKDQAVVDAIRAAWKVSYDLILARPTNAENIITSTQAREFIKASRSGPEMDAWIAAQPSIQIAFRKVAQVVGSYIRYDRANDDGNFNGDE